jgi:hypothetical protein
VNNEINLGGRALLKRNSAVWIVIKENRTYCSAVIFHRIYTKKYRYRTIYSNLYARYRFFSLSLY